METKPNYLLVGSFVIVLISAFIVICLMLLGYSANQNYKNYLILTKYSVNGLSESSLVKYKGVNAGSVEKIDIDPDNPEIIRIFVKIKDNVPIKTDTVATVTAQGLTGLASINLSGGTKNAKPLERTNNYKYPVIKSKMGEFQQISQNLPIVLNNANKLINDMAMIFNKENQAQIASILKNTNHSSKELEILMRHLSSTLTNANATITTIKQAGESTQETLNSTNVLIDSLQKSAQNLAEISSALNILIKKNKDQVNYFMHDGLENFNKLIQNLDKTTKQTDALINELRSNPSYIIYGVPKKPAPTEKHRE